MNSDLTVDELRAALHYDPLQGRFTWKTKPSKQIAAGALAGHLAADTGYVTIKIKSRAYKAHRLAWLYSHGTWPDGEIDHINGQKSDNRLGNLRDVPHSANLQNQQRAHRSNRLGVLGVYAEGARFIARIRCDGKPIHLGRFDSIDQARAAYVHAKRELHSTSVL